MTGREWLHELTRVRRVSLPDDLRGADGNLLAVKGQEVDARLVLNGWGDGYTIRLSGRDPHGRKWTVEAAPADVRGAMEAVR